MEPTTELQIWWTRVGEPVIIKVQPWLLVCWPALNEYIYSREFKYYGNLAGRCSDSENWVFVGSVARCRL
jgi:hypothetical protein